MSLAGRNAMTTTYAINEATSPLWFGVGPSGWGEVLTTVQPGRDGRTTAEIVQTCGLGWRVEQL